MNGCILSGLIKFVLSQGKLWQVTVTWLIDTQAPNTFIGVYQLACLIYWYLLSRDVWRNFRMKDTRIRLYVGHLLFGANRVKRSNFSEGLEASIGSHYLQLHCHCLWKIYSNTVVTCQNTLFGRHLFMGMVGGRGAFCPGYGLRSTQADGEVEKQIIGRWRRSKCYLFWSQFAFICRSLNLGERS